MLMCLIDVILPNPVIIVNTYFFLNVIEELLIYNAVLVSGVQQKGSVIHTSPLSPTFLLGFSCSTVLS